jgi:signal transduction histidine kinase
VSAFDVLPDAVVVSDAAGVITEVNAMASTMLRSDELVGQHRSKALTLITDSGDDWWECLERARGLGTVTRQPERLLRVVLDRDEVPVTVTMRFLADGTTVSVLREGRGRARQERSNSDLISTVAHELRSPLTSVKGFTATLLQKWDRFNDEQKKLMLTTVNADADRVTRLLSDLLDVSRIDSGRMELRKQVVDVAAAVRRAVDGRVASGESPETFSVRTEAVGEIWADPDKIDQIVGNLLENAVRHGAGGVHVVLAATPEGLRLEVHDEGPGVHPDQVARIFTKFWRDKTKRGGTGLGLYIVKGLAEAHGGGISVARSEHGGALFTIHLPRGSAPYDEPPTD